MNPRDLLTAARDMLKHPAAATTGVWPRACALLARQALEKTIHEVWAANPTTSGLTECTMRSQLTCLPTFLDPHLAHQITYVYAALSEACHYHAYELAPTATELTGWIDAVDQLMLTTRRQWTHEGATG